MNTNRSQKATGLLFVSLAFFSTAYADDYYCPSDYFGFYDSTVYGNIIVEEGKDCTLTGTMVYGNVLLYKNSSLTAYDVYIEGNIEAYMAKYVRLSNSNVDCMNSAECMTSKVIGDIKIEFAPEYMPENGIMPDEGMTSHDWESHVKNTMVDGNIQLYENWNPTTLFGNYVTGDIQASYNWGDLLIEMNAVEGNIQLEENKGYLKIADNYHVIGDVQAFYNQGGVTIEHNEIYGNLQCKGNYPMPYGGENYVYGNKEDQCADLYPDPDATEDMPATTGSIPLTATAGSTPTSGNSSSTGAAAATGGSAGGGATGPLLPLLLWVVAMLRMRRQRKLAV